MPSETNRVSELAIASNVDGTRSTVVISTDVGEKILRARKLAEAEEITDRGVVIQVNSKRNAIVLQSVRGKEVKCTLDDEMFRNFRAEGLLDNGARIRVTRPFSRRARRDLMRVKSLSQM